MNLIKKVSINQFSQKKDNTFNSSLLEIDPESLQIFYQLCLVNIEYIDDSPDPKGLFEMTLLKMLAFDLEEKKNSSVTKKGKNYPLLPYKLFIDNKYTAVIEDYESEFDYFVQTMITKIDTL